MILSDSQKKKTRDLISSHQLLNTGKEMSDEEWENYLLSEYTPSVMFEVDEDNFFTYKERPDYTFIHDFISTGNIKAYKLLEKIESFEKKVICQVAWTNLEILNTIIRRGFKIKAIKGYDYILEKS